MRTAPKSPMTMCSTTREEDGPAAPPAAPAVPAARGKPRGRAGRIPRKGKTTRKHTMEGATSRGRHGPCVGPHLVRPKQAQVGTSTPRKGCNADQEWALEDLLTGHRIRVVPSKDSGEIVTGRVVNRVEDGGRGGRHELVLQSGACKFFDLTQVDDWTLE